MKGLSARLLSARVLLQDAVFSFVENYLQETINLQVLWDGVLGR